MPLSAPLPREPPARPRRPPFPCGDLGTAPAAGAHLQQQLDPLDGGDGGLRDGGRHPAGKEILGEGHGRIGHGGSGASGRRCRAQEAGGGAEGAPQWPLI